MESAHSNSPTRMVPSDIEMEDDYIKLDLAGHLAHKQVTEEKKRDSFIAIPAEIAKNITGSVDASLNSDLLAKNPESVIRFGGGPRDDDDDDDNKSNSTGHNTHKHLAKTPNADEAELLFQQAENSPMPRNEPIDPRIQKRIHDAKRKIDESYSTREEVMIHNGALGPQTIRTNMILTTNTNSDSLAKNPERVILYGGSLYGHRLYDGDDITLAKRMVATNSDPDSISLAKKPQRVIICGRGGSGKTFLKEGLMNLGYACDCSVTSRPKRSNEKDDHDYHFVSSEIFEAMISEGLFKEHVRFNTWDYGTLQKSWNESTVFIMTPGAVNKLSSDDWQTSYVIYLDIPENIRWQRMHSRCDADTLTRRLEADQRDILNFDRYDWKITDSAFTISMVWAKMEQMNIKANK